ncbi:MAG TPA: hypothetical protein VF598_03950 [Hymenobacter sp.]|jgi:hypothetical protein
MMSLNTPPLTYGMPDPGNFLRALLIFVKVGLLWLILWLVIPSCATTRPRPAQEPLLTVNPQLHIQQDTAAPNVRYKRPNYARSLPEYHADPADTLPKNKRLTKETGKKHALQAGKGLFSFLSPSGGKNKSTQKDKRRITVNIYNGPSGVKNSTLAADHGTVVKTDKNVDRSKDQRHQDQRNQEGKKASLTQEATSKTGFVVPGWIWAVLLLVLLWVFLRRFWRVS